MQSRVRIRTREPGCSYADISKATTEEREAASTIPATVRIPHITLSKAQFSLAATPPYSVPNSPVLGYALPLSYSNTNGGDPNLLHANSPKPTDSDYEADESS